jgi:hypothetical protein
MSIPLDRLYHYIESVAHEIRGDNVLIYRFYPHGSKKIDDFSFLSHDQVTFKNVTMSPIIHCNDQEPLNYQQYVGASKAFKRNAEYTQEFEKHNLDWPDYNLRTNVFNIYDYSLLLHSEQRSTELLKYQSNFFIPVYYWSHAIIAKDWFRYAEHQAQRKHTDLQNFLIYNRAWSGTREYRIKFVDLLIEHNLVTQCKTSFNTTDPETQISYKQHNFLNSSWTPTNSLEQYYNPTIASSCASADFNLQDYNSTIFEVVLETLFDDTRIHLTEKSLRPIACGQPFILAATHRSLEYLRSYGFQTFNNIIDESYDLIEDPLQRLTAIVHEMKRISNWTTHEKQNNLVKLQQITNYNQQHFFSKKFNDILNKELHDNLQSAFNLLETKNTSKNYFAMRKKLVSIPDIREKLLNSNHLRTRQQLVPMIKKAREYYKKSTNK